MYEKNKIFFNWKVLKDLSTLQVVAENEIAIIAHILFRYRRK